MADLHLCGRSCRFPERLRPQVIHQARAAGHHRKLKEIKCSNMPAEFGEDLDKGRRVGGAEEFKGTSKSNDLEQVGINFL